MQVLNDVCAESNNKYTQDNEVCTNNNDTTTKPSDVADYGTHIRLSFNIIQLARYIVSDILVNIITS